MSKTVYEGGSMTLFDGSLIADLAAKTGDAKFTELGNSLGLELSAWFSVADSEPPADSLLQAARDFEEFCADHGAPIPSASNRVDLSATQAEVASAIRARLEQIIVDRGLPYVVTQAEFQEGGPEAGAAHLPEGTVWVVQFEDPVPTLDEVSNQTLVYDPLEAYTESLRSEFENGQLDSVVLYIVAWRNRTHDAFQITPALMAPYLAREITVKELAEKMVIMGL